MSSSPSTPGTSRGEAAEPAAPLAGELSRAAGAALAGLDRDPARALGTLVELIAADVLPRLRARLAAASQARRLDLELSEIAAALSMVAADRGLAPARPASMRLARRHVRRLGALVPALAALEGTLGSPGGEAAAAEDRARSELFFVAEPDRPATEAHVLRHAPRPPRMWPAKAGLDGRRKRDVRPA